MSGLGFVSKCTLQSVTKVHYTKVNGRSYCVVYRGLHEHSEAVKICKKLNARLPLPRDKAEANEFIKPRYSPWSGLSNMAINLKEWIHADARNPKKFNKKSEWIDSEDKQLGNRAVYLRVITYFKLSNITYFFNRFTLISSSSHSGRAGIR